MIVEFFEIACPACSEKLSFPAQASTARLTCPECRATFMAGEVADQGASHLPRKRPALLVALVLLAAAACAAFLFANAELRSVRREFARSSTEASKESQRLTAALEEKVRELQVHRERSDQDLRNSRAEFDRLALAATVEKRQTASTLDTAVRERDEARRRHTEVVAAHEAARSAQLNAENQTLLLQQKCDLLSLERENLKDALLVSGSSRSPDEQKSLAADIRQLAELARVNQAFRESMLDKSVWTVAGECDVLVRLSRSESSAAALAAGLLAFERGQVLVRELHQQAVRLASTLRNVEFRTDSARNIVARFNDALQRAQTLRERSGTDLLNLRNAEEQGAAFAALMTPFHEVDLGAIGDRILATLRTDSGARR